MDANDVIGLQCAEIHSRIDDLLHPFPLSEGSPNEATLPMVATSRLHPWLFASLAGVAAVVLLLPAVRAMPRFATPPVKPPRHSTLVRSSSSEAPPIVLPVASGADVLPFLLSGAMPPSVVYPEHYQSETGGTPLFPAEGNEPPPILLPPEEEPSSSSVSFHDLTLSEQREELRRRGGKGMLELMRRSSGSAVLVDEPLRLPDPHIGMYLTYNSMKRGDFVQQTIENTLARGGNALVFEVKGGNVHFQTSAPIANEIGTVVPAYDLPAFVAAARQKGIYTIGRFVSVKDPLLARRKPETCIPNAVRGGCVGKEWVDPGSPDTIEYNRQILVDLFQSGIDEVNFDYIRYPTEYDQRAIGLSGQEKADRLEAFLRMALQLRDALNPGTKIGISTYAILGWDYPINVEALGQDFVRFAPLVDIISPMAYPSSFAANAYYAPGKNPGPRMYYLVYRTLTGYADLLGPEEAKKLRPWIQGFFVTSEDVRQQIRAVYDAGACGFMVWNAQNYYEPTYKGLKMAEELRPEGCKLLD